MRIDRRNSLDSFALKFLFFYYYYLSFPENLPSRSVYFYKQENLEILSVF